MQGAEDPERGKVVKVLHPARADMPFARRAASCVVKKEHPNHGVHGIPVQAGETFEWSVWLKTEEVEGAEGAVLDLVWDPAGGPRAGEAVLFRETGTRDWYRLQGEFTAPPRAVMLRLYLGMRRATGTVYYDALSVRRQGAADELVVNGDFEKGALQPPHWDDWLLDDHAVLLAHWRQFCREEGIGRRSGMPPESVGE